MSAELTAADIDGRLSDLGITYRWRASVDGYSIVYTTFNQSPPYASFKDCLLRLHAVIEAIEASGEPGGVPLRSYQVPLLASEHDRLQREARKSMKGSKGGSAGKGRARSATVAVLRKGFAELGHNKKTETYLVWLRQDCVNCEYSVDGGTYEFNYNGLNATTLRRRDVMKAISQERKKT